MPKISCMAAPVDSLSNARLFFLAASTACTMPDTQIAVLTEGHNLIIQQEVEVAHQCRKQKASRPLKPGEVVVKERINCMQTHKLLI